MFNIGDKVRVKYSGEVGDVAFIIEPNGYKQYWVVFEVDDYNDWYAYQQLELVEE